jgi:hypothetical protein
VRHDVGATTARVHGQDEARGEGGGGGNGGLGPRRYQHGREWEGVGIERATSNGGVARHLTEGGPHDEAQPSVVSAWKAELPHPSTASDESVQPTDHLPRLLPFLSDTGRSLRLQRCRVEGSLEFFKGTYGPPLQSVHEPKSRKKIAAQELIPGITLDSLNL